MPELLACSSELHLALKLCNCFQTRMELGHEVYAIGAWRANFVAKTLARSLLNVMREAINNRQPKGC